MILNSSEVSSISGWLSFWEFLEYVSEIAVGLGCVCEYIAEYTKWRTEDARHILGRRSLIVLILGIGAGLLSLIQTNALSGKVIESLGRQAARAGETARLASEASDSALKKSKSSMTVAAIAEVTAGNAQAASNKAKALASEAEAKALDANSKYESERIARLKLEEQLAPRQISIKQRTMLIACLGSLKGEAITLVGIAADPELADFGNQLESVLRDAGIRTDPLNLFLPFGPSEIPDGLSLNVGNDRVATANTLAKCLVDAGLAKRPVPAGRSQEPGRLTINVGRKPR